MPASSCVFKTTRVASMRACWLGNATRQSGAGYDPTTVVSIDGRGTSNSWRKVTGRGIQGQRGMALPEDHSGAIPLPPEIQDRGSITDSVRPAVKCLQV